ncbi:MAG: uroporphyrinogen-III synthase, partial [Achromobacter sp.]|nr:uroporphyrinogen-III synthase [Achromobacter sp.]
MDGAAAQAPRVAVLTRPAGRNEALADRLRAAGWTPCILPAYPPLPPPRPRPANYDMVVFVSGNAA